MEIIPQLALIIFLVLLNGFFVASEFALVGVRKTRIDELAKKDNKSAKLVQKALNHLDTYISATQLGITLASLALGWVGEPFLAHFFEPFFDEFLPANLAFISSHGLAFAIAFSIITFLHIVLGELAPKSIALQKAEKTSLWVIRPLLIFTTAFKPFIYVLNGAGILVLKIIGFKAPSGHQLVHSEEEIKMILAQSAEEGAIEKQEAEMVYSVLKLGDTPVRKVMIPKSRVIAFEKDTSLKHMIKIFQKNPHSRFPIYQDDIDHILGFIHVKDVYKNLFSQSKFESFREVYLNFLFKNRERKLSKMGIIREVPKISENKKIDDAMILLREKRVHMAIVKDENNKTSGIVTLEDLVESLVGDIHDEFEIPENAKSKTEKVKKITSFIKRKI
ncbi:MAG: HlyC/CorC family transporter [Candidatus Levybacteria bacterium]|nr:HlyC/CorC family transporter [Candidatus Levybacteria bacterium]